MTLWMKRTMKQTALAMAIVFTVSGCAFAAPSHGKMNGHGGGHSFSRGGGFGGRSGGHSFSRGGFGGRSSGHSVSRGSASRGSRHGTVGYSRSRAGDTHYHYHDHRGSHTSGRHYHYHSYHRPYRYRDIHWHYHEHWGWASRYYYCGPRYYWYDSWYWPAGFTVGLILGSAVSNTPSVAANYYYNVCAEGCNCLDKYNPTPCSCTENCYCNAYHKK